MTQTPLLRLADGTLLAQTDTGFIIEQGDDSIALTRIDAVRISAALNRDPEFRWS